MQARRNQVVCVWDIRCSFFKRKHMHNKNISSNLERAGYARHWSMMFSDKLLLEIKIILNAEPVKKCTMKENTQIKFFLFNSLLQTQDWFCGSQERQKETDLRSFWFQTPKLSAATVLKKKIKKLKKPKAEKKNENTKVLREMLFPAFVLEVFFVFFLSFLFSFDFKLARIHQQQGREKSKQLEESKTTKEMKQSLARFSSQMFPPGDSFFCLWCCFWFALILNILIYELLWQMSDIIHFRWYTTYGTSLVALTAIFVAQAMDYSGRDNTCSRSPYHLRGMDDDWSKHESHFCHWERSLVVDCTVKINW